MFLVQAATEERAQKTAERTARKKEHEYVGGTGDLIRWTFEEIEAMQPLFDEQFENGTEVYWMFFERVDGAKQPRSRRGSVG